MKKLIALAVIASMSLTGCGGAIWSIPSAPIQRISFPEKEYTELKTNGNAKITGQVFAKTRGGDVKFGAGNTVMLNPVTSYSNQWYKEVYMLRNNISEGDIRQQQYIRKTIANGHGNFTFNNIPVGDYYLVSVITWEVAYGSTMHQQGGLIVEKVSVKENDVIEVMLTP